MWKISGTGRQAPGIGSWFSKPSRLRNFKKNNPQITPITQINKIKKLKLFRKICGNL
jgi:hypothetical protein